MPNRNGNRLKATSSKPKPNNLIEAQTQYKLYETEYLRATGRLE